MFHAFLVYDNNYDNAKAIFKDQGDANNYAAPNGWSVVPCEIPLPFFATPNIPVNPA